MSRLVSQIVRIARKTAIDNVEDAAVIKGHGEGVYTLEFADGMRRRVRSMDTGIAFIEGAVVEVAKAAGRRDQSVILGLSPRRRGTPKTIWL